MASAAAASPVSPGVSTLIPDPRAKGVSLAEYIRTVEPQIAIGTASISAKYSIQSPNMEPLTPPQRTTWVPITPTHHEALIMLHDQQARRSNLRLFGPPRHGIPKTPPMTRQSVPLTPPVDVVPKANPPQPEEFSESSDSESSDSESSDSVGPKANPPQPEQLSESSDSESSDSESPD